MNNREYAEQYVLDRGLKETSINKISLILDHYSKYQNATLEELIMEADQEEEVGIRWKRRTLKQRLINYMNYLKSQMLLSSAKTYFVTVKSFYTHHEIELGPLPKWNKMNAKLSEPITSKDMLTKPVIREALKVANHTMRPIILLEASSGMTKSDVLSLTVGDFIEATRPYHHSSNVQVAVELMLNEDMDMVPSFRMRRAKTNKYFVSFCSPEATLEICKYLRLRDKRNRKYHRPLLSHIDKLFKIHQGTYTDKFNEINNALNEGKAGTYNRLRGHMLRKFHATQLEKHGMSRPMVNVLQGKSNNAVDDVYFIEDEETLRDAYMNALEGVLIYTDVKEVNRYSPEFQRMEQENKQYKENLKSIWAELHDLKNRQDVWESLRDDQD